jgi:hypothetical protein
MKPVVSKEMNSRSVLHLIDMQSQADGEFKFITFVSRLLYQIHTVASIKNKMS